eukprot:TRINITY_DN11750_c0_g1_i1.p1 TRINITY_DN11750_c0_g1~~TRINITY_DN11750_c0_g1_i1.p1  ORF type:complete len:322 (-),score=57.84 TRINITY_DN11750_c0_g1_i1:366-1331(-)
MAAQGEAIDAVERPRLSLPPTPSPPCVASSQLGFGMTPRGSVDVAAEAAAAAVAALQPTPRVHSGSSPYSSLAWPSDPVPTALPSCGVPLSPAGAAEVAASKAAVAAALAALQETPMMPPLAPPPPKKSCVVFDFDSTLTSPRPMARFGGAWVIADRADLMGALTPEEVFENFGGAQRVAHIKSLLEALSNAGVAIYIVSLGLKTSILPHLATVSLAPFFRPDRVYGQDTYELRSRHFMKGKLIREVIMQPKKWNRPDVLFVDDSEQHIGEAQEVCECLHIPRGQVHGMNEGHLEAIRLSVFGISRGRSTSAVDIAANSES